MAMSSVSENQPEPLKTICLMSGGMDSTFAAYWATRHERLDVVAGVFFNYGQLGAGFEYRAAKLIADELKIKMVYLDVSELALLLRGSIMLPGALPANPNARDRHGNPLTFVPGRNLIHLALLAPMIYARDIRCVVGGWNAVDVDYPDCTEPFLGAAAVALNTALGRTQEDAITIETPVIRLTKAEEVVKGTTWGIPWEKTRSCYSGAFAPCGRCGSCIVRTKAFYASGICDPVYLTLDAWVSALKQADDAGALALVWEGDVKV